jgi:hypothetical protein
MGSRDASSPGLISGYCRVIFKGFLRKAPALSEGPAFKIWLKAD